MALNAFTVEGAGAPMGTIDAFALADLAHSGRLSGMQVRVAGTGQLMSEAEIASVIQSIQLPPAIPKPQMNYAPVDGNQDPMRFLAPIHASGWSVAAGYLGLFAVTLVLAPFAIGAGIMALRDLKAHPHKTGKGRAIFGLGMGVLCTFALLFLILVNSKF